jgi:sec-independent protein translocase protein TatB
MLSLPHLVVLFVVALVIFGPQKLPELARMLGKATAEFRKMTSDFRYALEDEVRDLERQTRIREEEIAAAANAVKPPPPIDPPVPPEFAMPRESPAAEAAVQTEAERPPLAYPGPEQPAPPQGVSAPQEKPSDDNTAV